MWPDIPVLGGYPSPLRDPVLPRRTPNPEPLPRVLILAGGIGSRFWPASTPLRPKQLLALGGRAPMVVEAVARALPLAGPDGIRILAGEALLGALRRVLPDLPDQAFQAEPRAKGTAPALAWAAVEALRADPDAVLISLHSDHVIDPPLAFHDLLKGAVRVAASTGLLLTVAIPPDRPETGYGYLLPGAPVAPVAGGVPTRMVARFVEKPDAGTAARYMESGYRWNSGIFVWRADRFLEEIREHSPEIAPHLPLLEAGDVEAFFQAVPPVAVDHAVLERSQRVAAVDATFRWDDVGSWEALSRTQPADSRGNVGVGAVHQIDCDHTVAWGEDGPVILWGVEGLVVVRAGGVTLVCPRERTADLKTLLAQLPEDLVHP